MRTLNELPEEPQTNAYVPAGQLVYAPRVFAACVVSHQMNNRIVYFGARMITKAFDITKQEANSVWRRYLDEAGGILKIQIVFMAPSYDAAWQRCDELRRAYNVPVKGDAMNMRGSVVCVDTGQRYASGADAARANGIHKGSMSHHLNARIGYETIHGMTFRRG